MDRMAERIRDIWCRRAVMCELLALSLRYPQAALADAVASGEWAEAAEELAGNMLLQLPKGFDDDARASVGKDPEILIHVLRAEATRLFICTPGPAVSPFEGVWRAVDDEVQPLLFVNPHSMDVERFCRACGLGRPAGTNEPLDHVATELELMQYLCMLEAGIAEPPQDSPALVDLPGGSAAAAFDRFMESHALVWMPRFASKLAVETREPFFRAVAGVLEAFLSSWQDTAAE